MTDVKYVGKVQSIEEKKAGWHAIHIAVPGKQYPIKADTKLEPLLKSVREIRDGDLVATFTVSETESENINPNNGKPYTERRLERVEAGAQQLEVSTNGDDSGMSKEEWAKKDSAIHKMACIKTAATVLTHTLPSDPTAADLGKFIERTAALAAAWHASVLSVRDGTDDIPFD